MTTETATVAEIATAASPSAPPSRSKVVWGRFISNKGSLAGAVAVVLLFLLAFVGPVFSSYQYTDVDYTALQEPPSGAHWFGTDQIGRDMFTLTLRGLQKSLLIGLLVAMFSTVLASIVGACAGYFGGWVDRVAMFVVDLMLVFPAFLIISIMSPMFKESGWIAFVGLLAVFGWMITARVVRSMTLSLKDQEFVRAARFMGVHPFRIILRHILPNMASFLIIDATIAVGGAIMAETGLSYFGFGVQSPDVSLGTLISLGEPSALTQPWMFYFAAGLLVLFVLAVNLMGDGLRDALDPTSDRVSRKQRRAIAREAKAVREKAAAALAANTSPTSTHETPGSRA
ncbi:ABC transporter permease [Streptomyces sp. NPDC021093]|uniref:ABC transporter permease n=1 Tax=Streptomyces sp. NPDC021093 TaxID=3365112 RepID=UPI0037B7AAA6